MVRGLQFKRFSFEKEILFEILTCMFREQNCNANFATKDCSIGDGTIFIGITKSVSRPNSTKNFLLKSLRSFKFLFSVESHNYSKLIKQLSLFSFENTIFENFSRFQVCRQRQHHSNYLRKRNPPTKVLTSDELVFCE